MFELVLNVYQHGMSAADDEGHIRFELREISLEGAAFRPGRIEMGFMMVNSEKWPPQEEGHRLRGFESDHQRARQAGALRGCYGFEFRWRLPSREQSGPGYREEVPEMLACGQLGHYPAILGVKLNLGGNNI